jgi:hypothetical protein
MSPDMKAKLSDRFERFVRTLEGFEDIDELMIGVASEMKRADYLLRNRQIIIEQKALTADPEHKVQKYADKFLGEGQFLATGRFSLYPILDKASDGINHHGRLLNDLSNVLEKNISDADKQLRDSRKIFSIPAAMGVVVMLNEGAVSLDPQLSNVRIDNLLAEKAGSDLARFQNTDLVITISDIHALSAALPYKRMGFHVSPTSANSEAAFCFAEDFKRRWIGFDGVYVGSVRPPSPEQVAKLYGNR